MTVVDGITPAAARTLARADAADPGYATRPRVGGKFVFVGEHKLWIRGVTYGGFAPGADGHEFPADDRVESDFAAMRANAVNTVRCYTVPPRRLLDAAMRHGLRVIVGLPWEQHVAFLDDPGRADDIERRVRDGVRRCAGHPALLCVAIGNEIPASIVRWHGRRRIEDFLHRLYRAAKAEDPGALVTYVNFPTTEYLRLPFLDLVSFNVYLESRPALEGYLARVQNIAGEKPLLMAEIGLDSRRNGVDAQAASLDWQVRSAFAEGCAGTVAFAWTDEWHRGGHDIDDWDFGLVTRDRTAKPALAALRRAYTDVPFPPSTRWPRVSIVLCSFNGSRTIRDTLEGCARLAYPDFELIMIDDGSTDTTASIVAQYPAVRLTSTPNRGLSAARNTGWQQASGEIVAYIDDDAYPDPHWLHYLAWRFMHGDWVGVGGPNIAPPGDGPIADCVANAPGGPVHVLVSDTEAEHIPGCNMAFRRDALEAIGGFDVRYRTAGDDVDVCWRLTDRGGRIGFHAGAMDWHHRRDSLKMYWNQQKGYGRAEALLEAKWPERYNAAGHVAWTGRLYGRGFTLPLPSGRSRVYGGVWGSAGYQSLYEPRALTLLSLPLMPEWWLLVAALAVLSLLALAWAPLAWALPLLALAAAAPVAQAARAATRAQYPDPPATPAERRRRWAVTFALHLMQPMARLNGRFRHGLTPWRRRSGDTGTGRVAATAATLWSEHWQSPEQWLHRIESALRAGGSIVRRGSDFDDWDLEVRGGLFGSVRARVGIEEHGAGRQQLLLAAHGRPAPWSTAVAAVLGLTAVVALADAAVVAGFGLVLAAGAVGWATTRDIADARSAWRTAVAQLIEPAAASSAVDTDRCATSGERDTNGGSGGAGSDPAPSPLERADS